MSNMGQFGLQSAGVNISMSEDVTVKQQHVSDSPRGVLTVEGRDLGRGRHREQHDVQLCHRYGR